MSFPPDRAAFDRAFPLIVNDERMLLQVAEIDGFVCGYALTAVSLLLHTNGESAQLQELVVDVEHRGHGLGTALLVAAEAECAARGVRQLTVASRRAAAFYADRGYTARAEFLTRAL